MRGTCGWADIVLRLKTNLIKILKRLFAGLLSRETGNGASRLFILHISEWLSKTQHHILVLRMGVIEMLA